MGKLVSWFYSKTIDFYLTLCYTLFMLMGLGLLFGIIK